MWTEFCAISCQNNIYTDYIQSSCKAGDGDFCSFFSLKTYVSTCPYIYLPHLFAKFNRTTHLQNDYIFNISTYLNIQMHFITCFPAATGTTSALIVAEVGGDQMSRVGLRTSEDWDNITLPSPSQHHTARVPGTL